MIVNLITFMYNEQFLLPFFLKHYDWVDKINVIYDQDSNDMTLNILKSYSKVNIIPFKFPNMMNDVLKVKKINKVYKNLRNCDWILLVDADEFIFIDKSVLEKLTIPVANVKLFNVYRHYSEKDLDPNKPIKEQRRHGFLDERYNKPIIVKPGLDIFWGVGNHTINKPSGTSAYFLGKMKKIIFRKRFIEAHDCGIIGAHWANADPCFCVERRIKGRRDRQSHFNLKHNLTYQHHNIRVEDVLAECKMHEKDPVVF